MYVTNITLFTGVMTTGFWLGLCVTDMEGGRIFRMTSDSTSSMSHSRYGHLFLEVERVAVISIDFLTDGRGQGQLPGDQEQVPGP